MNDSPDSELPRRKFFKRIAASAALLSVTDWKDLAAAEPASSDTRVVHEPWFKRCRRWGQINLAEIDPTRMDLKWWRGYWKNTHLQGVVVNAGGIVAYYPTEIPLHRRAKFLGDRDLFGEIRQAAREDGIAVFARMDSNRADEAFYRAHPDWFGQDATGNPYKVGDLYQACVNGPYYDEHIPAILREVVSRYHPEGFTDNNWNGLMRHQPCHCANCERKFLARTGQEIPRNVDWNASIYREWIMWNYERRMEIWDRFNRTAREAGGPECLWVGMMAGSSNWQSRVFREDREVYRRTEIIMLDDQRRFDREGFQHNGEVGKRIRGTGGWDKVIAESMAMYHAGEHGFRLAAKPGVEAKMWVLEGLAGGLQPWWHIIGSDQQDRRVLETAPPLWRWHRDHEEFLINRQPVVTIGLVWSQRNMDFFGRDDGALNVDDPWNGFTQALVRARISYVPVHIDDLEKEVTELGLRLLILPNLAAMSDAQVETLKRFVANGGSIFATGVTSLCNEWGEPRPDFALAELFGAHVPPGHAFRDEAKRTDWARNWTQTYLRLTPELRGGLDGPRAGGEPPVGGNKRHPVLQGFEETDILAYGSMLEALTLDSDVTVPLTFVPAIPATPVESAWMHVSKTDIPGLVLRELSGGGRVAYLPADIDRRFALENLPDHGDLLANIVRWSVKEDLPLRIEGTGLIDGHLYRQPGRLVLHLINLTSAGTWRTPVHELIPVGPLRVSVQMSKGGKSRVRSLVTGDPLVPLLRGGWLHFEISSISDHDVLVIG